MRGRSRHSSSHEEKTRCTGDTHNSAPQATAKKTRPEKTYNSQHGPHTTRKGTNGHVTMYIMYITVISHGNHPNVRIRVSIKLHLQDHLSIASSHCTALPIPSQHHSPRTTVPPPYSQHCPQCVDNILSAFLGHSGGSLQAPMWLHVQGNLSKILNTQTS